MIKNSIGRFSEELKEKFTKSLIFPFKGFLTEQDLHEMIEAEGIIFRNRCFTPIVTFYAFIAQVLDEDSSCRKALSRIIRFLASQNKVLPSTNTSAYCQARERLSSSLIQRTKDLVRDRLEKRVKTEQLWCGRTVKIADGSTVSMPDTPSNQKAFPQPTSQKKGCGFPSARIVVFFSLVTGALLQCKIGKLKDHERSLFRKLWDTLSPGDVILADRGFCSYADIALLQKKKNVDTVFRLLGRKARFSQGKRLGKKDHIVTWKRPVQRPKGLLKTLFRALPKTITVRELQFSIQEKGFRSKEVTLVTTLLDEIQYPKSELIRLYRRRWEAELYLKDIKTSMKMDVLRCESPKMVEKEIRIIGLAYNLIRALMWDSAQKHNTQPLMISLRGTIQHVCSFTASLGEVSKTKANMIVENLSLVIAKEQLPHRKKRFEPRVVKRRPKAYPRMTEPRKSLKERLTA